MKSKFTYLILAVATFSFSACEDLLDVNTDPLVATTANAELLFPDILINLSNPRTVEMSLGAGTISQHYEGAFTVFGNAALGIIDVFTPGNVWSAFYLTTLKNLVLIENEALQVDPPNNNIVAQSQILQGFTYYNLTTIFEDIPFTEAVSEATEPISDSQETVLRGIIGMMNAATGLIDKTAGAPKVISGDLLYGGDLDRWERFANSIKLKCLMLLANKDASVASEIATTITQPLITSVEDEAEFKYFNNAGDYNPIWAVLNNFAAGANPEWIMGSTTLQTILQDLNDPRLSTYYDESDEASRVGTGNFAPGATPGSFGEFADHSVVSFNILRPDAPDRYITSSEIVLLIAEAVARGLAPGGMSQADQIYRTGVNLSMSYYDGKPGQINASQKVGYVNSLVDLTSISAEQAVETIQLQLYIATFMRTPESWTQWRRTKVPDLVLPRGSLFSGVIRRFPYPADEKGSNRNSPSDKLLDAPMWFEN